MDKQQYESIFAHRKAALLKAHEVEQDLNLTAGIIHQWIYRGTMPFPYVRAAGQIRIRKEAVIAWLMEAEVPAGHKPATANASGHRTRRGRKEAVSPALRIWRGRRPDMPNTTFIRELLEIAITTVMHKRINGRPFHAWAWHFDSTGRTEFCRQSDGWEVVGKSPKCRREKEFLHVVAVTEDGERIEQTYTE